MVNWIFLAVVAGIALLGFLQGFNRCLKFYFKGFLGWIISVFLCFALGGMILKIPFIERWIESLNQIFVSHVSFLDGWAALTIYFIALFIVINIIKLIFTNLLIKFFSMKNIVIKILNKLIGICFSVVMAFMFMWLIVSVIAMFENGRIVENMYTYLGEKGGNLLVSIIKWNPIKNLFSL